MNVIQFYDVTQELPIAMATFEFGNYDKIDVIPYNDGMITLARVILDNGKTILNVHCGLVDSGAEIILNKLYVRRGEIFTIMQMALNNMNINIMPNAQVSGSGLVVKNGQ